MSSSRTQHARRMRRDMATDVERVLWRALRARQLGGKFRRQQPIGPYIVDFVCFEARLIIELDGGQHADGPQARHDRRRDAWLAGQGFRLLRFWNNQVTETLEGVMEMIGAHCGRSVFTSSAPGSTAAPST